MKKFVGLFVCVVVMLVALQVLAEYDKNLVVNAMRANGTALGGIQKAIGEQNFFGAAEQLMEIAKNIKALDGVTPPKGDKAEWDRIHTALIKAAFKGIGACGEEDVAKLNAAVGEIVGYMKEGHKMFK
jgi:hypothetical protein